jgi:Domain of unknown function (DUF4281)
LEGRVDPSPWTLQWRGDLSLDKRDHPCLFTLVVWKYTHVIAWIPIFINAILYLISLIMLVQSGRTSGSFDSLEGIVTLFSDPNTVFVGLIHYLSFDLFVARAISLDAIQHATSSLQYILLVGPCLFFCLMAGPVRLLLYAIVKISVFQGMTKEKES